MQHSNDLIETAADQTANLDGSRDAQAKVLMADRSTPKGALFVAISYMAIISGIYFSVAVSAVFVFDLVAVNRQFRFAPIFVPAMLVPLLGTLLIDYAYRWSMGGIKDLRTAIADRAMGMLGCVAFAVITFVQPFFALPILMSVGISGVGLEVLRRFDRTEDAWEFGKEEATSLLSGRDNFGFELAMQKKTEHGLALSLHRFGVIFAGLAGFSLGSWLVARTVLTLEAVASLAFISMLTTDMILRAVRSYAFANINQQNRDTVVTSALRRGEPTQNTNLDRFVVSDLTVMSADGVRILDKVCFEVTPGSLVQVTGASGDGKSLLLEALSDPFSIQGCQIEGDISFAGLDLWERQANQRSVPAVRVDACPLILPASAQDNLTCFQPELHLDRAKAILNKIVFSQDIISKITSATVHAPNLPLMQQKVLGLVRAFLISPQVLLLDCPEAFLPERQIGQVLDLLKAQSRLGRVAILVTENRALMEACDKVLVLQGGRAIDFGDGEEIRARHGSGWRRFNGKRRLETEEPLHSWLRSQFIRDGDEGNRRRVCKIGSNVLAHFCLSCPTDDDGEITFECKQKAGVMEMRVSDDREPISTVQFAQARNELDAENMSARLTPLAQVIRDTISAQPNDQFGQRDLSLEIETYDPRKRSQKDAK